MTSITKKFKIPCSLENRNTYKINSGINKRIKSSIYFTRSEEDRAINAKSILGLLSAQFYCGEEIIVYLIGNSEQDCNNDFNELQKIFNEMRG